MSVTRYDGGILADSMGIVKTIQLTSLVHAPRSRSEGNQAKSEFDPTAASASKLPPLTYQRVGRESATHNLHSSLLAQWHSEAERVSVKGSLTAILYYGADKPQTCALSCDANAASSLDVIITSC